MLSLKKIFEPGSPFAYKDFRRIFLSSTIVTLGTGAFPMALAIVIIDSGGSATTLGLVLAAKMLSGTTFVLVGGVWADRIKSKYVMMSADSARAALLIALVFASGPNTPRYWMALIVFLAGIGDAFGGPASMAIMTKILPEEALQKGNVFRGVISRLGGIIGPALGAVVVALVGARLTFLLTAATFTTSVILLSGVKESRHIKRENHEPFLVEMKEGLRVVRDMPWVGAMILMATFQLLIVISAENVLLPVITKREFHTNSVMAAAMASFAIGASLAAMFSLKIKTDAPGRVSLLMWSLFAFIPLALAFPHSKALIVLAYIAGGIAVGPWDAFWPIALQREVPKEKLGRVFALDHAGSAGLMPLGMALVGPVTSLVGEQRFLIFAAAFHLLVNIIVYQVPGVKHMKVPNSSNSEQN